ncbi:AMIN domain-containing protein [Myxococcus sp. K38C18041901]|uniref:AMIN domain-containing protein n=1 Tax=Myxococcus guangdongensis TaxID=2906760 RepID=UPI0020A8350A|nr:AMIN domain-containing protein [Myxococcus guangdongensis]MCP3060823.1 AMIN domain-containing protein [Myxococcus guangdongensis]
MKASAVWLLGVVLVPCMALAQAPAANLNTITSVQVNGGTVTISGSKKANFTTFTMTDPPRLVIDIAEAVFNGVPEETQVGNGTVTGIRTASYGSDDSAIARVLIGFEREVETDIQATDSQLVVKVVGGAGQAVAQAAPTPPAAQPATDGSAAEAAARAESERQAQEKAAAEAAARAESERQAQEKAAAEATARAQQDADAERQRQKEAEARAVAQREEEQRSAQAAADDRKRQEAEAQASAKAAADERKRQEEEARASAQAAADERRATAQAAADEKKRAKEDALAAAKTAAEDKRAAAQAAKEEAAEARRQREEEARAERERRQQERVAMAAQPRERREVSSGGSSEVSSRRKTMTLVGFQQQGGVSRVFIRTNEPVRYSVSETGNAVVLELENSRIDLSNNTRPLDTSYFNSPVTRVDADAEGRNVRVTVQLRQQAPVQARQDGNVISLDFQRTAR